MFILVNPQVLPTQHQPRKKGQKTYLICTLLSGHYVPVVFPKLVRFRQAQVYALPRYIYFFGRRHIRELATTFARQFDYRKCYPVSWSWAVYEFMTCKSLFYEHRTPDLVPSSIPFRSLPFHNIPSPTTHLRAES